VNDKETLDLYGKVASKGGASLPFETLTTNLAFHRTRHQAGLQIPGSPVVPPDVCSKMHRRTSPVTIVT